MDITIAPATPADYDQVGDLVAGVFLDDGLLTFGENDSYLGVLRDSASRAAKAELLVARAQESGEILGSVTYAAPGTAYSDLRVAGSAEFRMLVVAPAGRGRGIGEALVRACIERAREQGARSLVLSTQARMKSAHRLYERLGFVRTPERDWSPVAESDLTLLTYELAL
ncbi:N-acetyltransferase family protein [Streptomyces boninensis]|uniref:GNAT family N-acetyltransferase n=1 Tax=Streptomyces boninensis TaxID=2039455 RepID=UPI003B220A47